jgi:hypothetical protein
MMLTIDDIEREYGMASAQLDATIFDATRAYGIKQFGLDLDHYAANTTAYNSISTSAHVAPTASFMTQRPIEQKAPPKPSPLGPILSGISTGLGAATTLGGEDYFESMFNKG